MKSVVGKNQEQGGDIPCYGCAFARYFTVGEDGRDGHLVVCCGNHHKIEDMPSVCGEWEASFADPRKLLLAA